MIVKSDGAFAAPFGWLVPRSHVTSSSPLLIPDPSPAVTTLLKYSPLSPRRIRNISMNRNPSYLDQKCAKNCIIVNWNLLHTSSAAAYTHELTNSGLIGWTLPVRHGLWLVEYTEYINIYKKKQNQMDSWNKWKSTIYLMEFNKVNNHKWVSRAQGSVYPASRSRGW